MYSNSRQFMGETFIITKAEYEALIQDKAELLKKNALLKFQMEQLQKALFGRKSLSHHSRNNRDRQYVRALRAYSALNCPLDISSRARLLAVHEARVISK
jgi:predicted TPR repeat methyltransferase